MVQRKWLGRKLFIQKKADFTDKPEQYERNNTNEMKIKSFQNVKEKWRELCSYFRAYPDRFIDFIRDDSSNIHLYFYQRIHLRILLRYRRVFITATRGTSKSYIVMLAYILKCIFYPGIRLCVCAKGKFLPLVLEIVQ